MYILGRMVERERDREVCILGRMDGERGVYIRMDGDREVCILGWMERER